MVVAGVVVVVSAVGVVGVVAFGVVLVTTFGSVVCSKDPPHLRHVDTLTGIQCKCILVRDNTV